MTSFTGVFARKIAIMEAIMGLKHKMVVDFTLPIYQEHFVLAAGIPKGRSPSMWAYVNVFGIVQIMLRRKNH